MGLECDSPSSVAILSAVCLCGCSLVDVTDGGVAYVDGGITYIDGGVAYLDGGVAQIDGGVAYVDGGVAYVDGGVIDGGVAYIDGGVVDGGVAYIDGGVAYIQGGVTDGGVSYIDGGVAYIDGGVIDGGVAYIDGGVIDGGVAYIDGGVIDGGVAYIDGGVTDGGVEYVDGGIIVSPMQTTHLDATVTWRYSPLALLYFSESEITVDQFRACVAAGPCVGTFSTVASSGYCNYDHTTRPGDHPMNCVNALGAEAFCAWVGGRLPTEEEWYAEASNGGTRTYPWGEQGPTCARVVMFSGGSGCGQDATWPVCGKRGGDSVSGLCDMSGNIWEWTATTDQGGRVRRGGSFYFDAPWDLAASSRETAAPLEGTGIVGFRCVRSAH